jgi:hypothetical protein
MTFDERLKRIDQRHEAILRTQAQIRQQRLDFGRQPPGLASPIAQYSAQVRQAITDMESLGKLAKIEARRRSETE